jgi:hypothetical protein
MNRSFIAALVAATTTLVATTATSARADFVPEPPPAPTEEAAPKADVRDPLVDRFAIHLDPVVNVPFAPLSDDTGIGAGAMLGGEYRVSPSLSFTAHCGYISGMDQRRRVADFQLASSIDTAPVLGGIKYYAVDAQEGLFLSAEFGSTCTARRAWSDARAARTSSSSAINFGGLLSAGYHAAAGISARGCSRTTCNASTTRLERRVLVRRASNHASRALSAHACTAVDGERGGEADVRERRPSR